MMMAAALVASLLFGIHHY